MICPSCQAACDDTADTCFRCGKSLFALTQGSVLGGRYEIVGSLGKGGMGMVYKAYDREFDEYVALKVLRAEVSNASDVARRFRSEGKLARKVSHPNVCRIHEYARDGHRSYIVMELVEGTDFKRILHERGPLPAIEAYDVAIQVASALDVIHRAGIVHRDLKTANIMCGAGGVVKLMDFGIAKSYESVSTGATATGHVVGTPEYMSPEQARGEKLDARTDIYALGIVTFELFTGDVPFRGDTPVVVLFKHIQEPPPLRGPAAAKLPRPLLGVLERALAKSRDQRFASAGAMAEALSQAKAMLGGEAFRTPTPSPILVTATPDEVMTEALTTPVPTPTPLPSPVVVAQPGDTPKPVLGETSGPAPAAVSAADVPSREFAVGLQVPATYPERRARPAAARAQRPSLPKPLPPARVGAGVLVITTISGLVVVTALLQVWTQLRPTRSDPPAVAEPTLAATPPPVTLPPSTPETTQARYTPTPTAAPTVTSVAPMSLPALPPRPTASPEPARPPVTIAPAVRHEAPPTLPTTSNLATPAAPSPVASPANEPISSEVKPDAERHPLVADAVSPAATGFLQLGVRPWAEVSIDGVKVGISPVKVMTLAEGSHSVRLVHPDYQAVLRKVTIRPGETTQLQVDLGIVGVPK